MKVSIGPFTALGSENTPGTCLQGYSEIAPCTYATYTDCSPFAVDTLADNFARLLKFAPDPSPLIDAVNRQIFPGTLPGGFYLQVYSADPASGFLCLAHGAVFAKAGKTPKVGNTCLGSRLFGGSEGLHLTSLPLIGLHPLAHFDSCAFWLSCKSLAILGLNGDERTRNEDEMILIVGSVEG
jgi:hypothetical protein